MRRPNEFLLLKFRQAFEASGNPYYAWAALRLCTDLKKPLSPWLTAYLFQCSQRMLSEKAEQASDLREILPWVFGFPNRTKKGWSDKISLRMWKFVTEFGVRILQDEDPVAARRNACNDAFDGKGADVDDKTLTRWLNKAFLLEKTPKDARQWKKIVSMFGGVMDAHKQIGKMDMTSAEAAKASEIIDDALKHYGQFLARF
jgi:hypothetical protein